MPESVVIADLSLLYAKINEYYTEKWDSRTVGQVNAELSARLGKNVQLGTILGDSSIFMFDVNKPFNYYGEVMGLSNSKLYSVFVSLDDRHAVTARQVQAKKAAAKAAE